MRLSIFSLGSANALAKRLTPSPGGERAGVWDLSAWRRFLAPGIKILRRSAEKMRCAPRSHTLPSPIRERVLNPVLRGIALLDEKIDSLYPRRGLGRGYISRLKDHASPCGHYHTVQTLLMEESSHGSIRG